MAVPALSIEVEGKTSKWKKSMDTVSQQADKAVADVESKFASFDPQLNTESYTRSITSMVTAFGIAGVAAGSVVALVVSLNKSLADTATTADRVGLSIERFQQLKFGANSLGISDQDFAGSLDRVATNLQNAKFQANDLTRIFAAQPGELGKTNVAALTMTDLLTKSVDIIKRAPTIQDALQIGSMIGFSREFSQSIHDAGDNYLRLASQANAAGAVIDDATIKKAKTFSDEWQKAAAIWSNNMRAAVGDVLPLLNDAVNGAVALISSVKSVYGFISAIKDFAFAPDINTASLSQLNSLLQQYQEIKKTLDAGQKLNPIQLFQGSNIQTADHEITREAVDVAIKDVNDQIKKRQKDVEPIRVRISTGASVNPGPRQAEGGRDQFEIGVDAITKRTATINADTAATFQNNAVQAQFRAEFQLLTAVMRDGGEVTQAQIDTYERLRQSMTAQQALEASGIQLTGDHAAKFISASEGIKAATAAYDGARESLNRINSASQQLGSALATGFADAVVEGKNLNEVVGSLLKTLEKAAINSAFSALFNAPGSGGLSPFASGVQSLFGIGHNAGGTDSWRGGKTWINENTPNPEIVDLPRGSRVTPSAPVSSGGRSGNVNVTLVEDSSRGGQTQKRDNDGGGFDLQIYVDSITAKNAANPGSATSRVLDSRNRLAAR